MANSYKVRPGAGEVSVPKDGNEILNPFNGEVVGYEHSNETYFEGEVIAEEDVARVVKQKLEDGDEYVSSILEPVEDDPSVNVVLRYDLPFDGYDNLSEEDVVAALNVLPGSAVQSIKNYEADNQNRSEIVQYDAGKRAAPSDRLRGNAGSDYQPADAKDAANTVTRQVNVDDESGEVKIVQGEAADNTGGIELAVASDDEGEEEAPSSEFEDTTSVSNDSGSSEE